MRYCINTVKLLFVLLLSFSQNSFAQEEVGPTKVKEKIKNRHYISVTFAETYIPEGSGMDNLDHKGHFVPGIGFDYFYRFKPKFEVGVMIDYELGHYLIPHEEDLERENALILCGVVTYELIPNWVLFAGGGVEFEKHEHLAVYRVGTEVSIDLGKDWAIPFGVFYDIKNGYYNTLSFSVGVGKAF